MRVLLGRDSRRVLLAATRPAHYRAALNTVRVYRRPVEGMSRYLGESGAYPWSPQLRTPTGVIAPTLHGPQDVRTVNEIFCRLDYGRGGQRVVVDLGANIGLSALFFLTRRPDCVVHAVEPAPVNQTRLRANLAPYADRVHLDHRAAAPHGGHADFLVESTGRLGGLAAYTGARVGSTITVETVAVADLLAGVLEREGRIDLVKIDTEGSERVLVDAIPAEQRARIGAIVWENNDGTVRWAH